MSPWNLPESEFCGQGRCAASASKATGGPSPRPGCQAGEKLENKTNGFSGPPSYKNWLAAGGHLGAECRPDGGAGPALPAGHREPQNLADQNQWHRCKVLLSRIKTSAKNTPSQLVILSAWQTGTPAADPISGHKVTSAVARG